MPIKLTKSGIILILVNIIPVLGVGFLGWSLFDILMAYWLENVVIGFYNIFKIALAQRNIYGVAVNGNFFKIFLVPFFIFHFGGFCLGHLIFIYTLFGPSGIFLKSEFNYQPLAIMFGMYFVSHGVSFWQNYIANGEYRQMDPSRAMGLPYSRVVVMHLCVMASAFIFAFLGIGNLAKVLVVVIKTALDYFLHQKQHQNIDQL